MAKLLRDRLMTVKAQVKQLLEQEVPAFNDKLRGRNIHPVISEGGS